MQTAGERKHEIMELLQRKLLAYTYFVVNPINRTGHKVIVDAGNGKVLYTSEGLLMASLASSWKGHGSWHGFEGSWKGHGPGGYWHGLFGS